jgi:hypothetical protein
MSRIRSKITYANVVATLALFIALGGVSYAAVKLPANSVGEKQIKKNAVTGKKIKKSTITGDKIKNGTLTPADINIASLGKLPSAARADSAGNADTTSSVSTFTKRLTQSASEATQDAARAAATPVTLVSYGQVSIYAKCYVVGTTLLGETYAKSTADGALALGGNAIFIGSGPNAYLNTSTPEGQRYLQYGSAATNNYGYGNSSYNNGDLIGPDGNGLSYQIFLHLKQGNIPTYGNGAYGAGNVCIFNGFATKNQAG